MRMPPLEFLRKICLKCPQAEEKTAWGDPTFRVRGKIFAMYKVGDGRTSVWCRAHNGAQTVLVDSQPSVFFVPPYVGRHGWIGIRLDVSIDKRHVAHLLKESYQLIAPKSMKTPRRQ
jgi:predicted DNA-binding protein (MmcQ/YjbR family)